ncbi:hypothetical protein GCM10023331_31770 [Algivirga pacifica]|uniref:Uncharacterized protein n=2 Tax=Algivirga pacifica TaxID=1162670 RepID=A0ABP9DFY8_9BACT
MPEFPKCVDSLVFEASRGYAYSCESEFNYEFNFRVDNDTLYLERIDFASEMDTLAEVSSKEWFKMTDKGLVWIKVKRKNGEIWNDLEDEYLNQFYYKKL